MYTLLQPPLYKYEKGKQVNYVLSDKEALQYKTNMAINSGSIFVNKEAAPLSGMPLESLFNDYNKVMSRMPKLTQKIQKDIVLNIMYYNLLSEDLMSSESDVKEWAEGFIKQLPSNASEGVFFKAEVKHDPVTNLYYPLIIQHVHGIDYKYLLDDAFYKSIDYSMLKNMNSKVNGLIEKDGFVQVGAKQIPA